jgi:hypothetical protein
MPALDERTVECLAELICDLDGPYERKGYELEALLRRAGWMDPPEYDASARAAWLRDVLYERRHRQGDVERLICRVCDPIEYRSEAVAEGFRCAVNEVIALEGLVVTVVAGRPVLGALNRSGEATYSAPADLDRRLRELILDGQTASLLIDRIRETEICAANGAYTFAIIGIGSFVEGLLQTVLSERDEQIRTHGFLDDKGRTLQDHRIGLQYLIDLARSHSWIQLDAADFMHKVREYRNYVHPRVQQRDPQQFDHDSVMLCWAPVRAVLNDLEEQLARTITVP